MSAFFAVIQGRSRFFFYYLQLKKQHFSDSHTDRATSDLASVKLKDKPLEYNLLFHLHSDSEDDVWLRVVVVFTLVFAPLGLKTQSRTRKLLLQTPRWFFSRP